MSFSKLYNNTPSTPISGNLFSISDPLALDSVCFSEATPHTHIGKIVVLNERSFFLNVLQRLNFNISRPVRIMLNAGENRRLNKEYVLGVAERLMLYGFQVELEVRIDDSELKKVQIDPKDNDRIYSFQPFVEICKQLPSIGDIKVVPVVQSLCNSAIEALLSVKKASIDDVQLVIPAHISPLAIRELVFGVNLALNELSKQDKEPPSVGVVHPGSTFLLFKKIGIAVDELLSLGVSYVSRGIFGLNPQELREHPIGGFIIKKAQRIKGAVAKIF